MKTTMTYVVRSCLIVGLAFAGCSDPSWSIKKTNESKARGARIVAALNNYYSDHGKFPQNLQELVPKYLARLEPPTAGNCQWVYITPPDLSVFSLCFEDNSASKPTYWIKKEGVWTV